MKILSIQFQNLNSLKGVSPKIKFTEGVLGESGLFAITGPTGAGKTTLLDAVCVALYGQTPRLKNGGSIRQIMTRHTGECWSEVEFITQGTVYRSRWYLRKSRKDPLGEFQNPRGELVEVHTNTIVEDRLSRIHEKVAELTSLDFNRFCRSVMLAQGDFSAFLEARGDERAELLEKITGTEIYSQISSEAFQRAKEEREKLQKQREELKGLDLLSQEETDCIKGEISELTSDLLETKKLTEETRSQLAVYNRIKTLKGTLEQTQKGLKENSEEFLHRNLEFTRLEIHKKAEPLYALLESLQAEETELQDKEKDLMYKRDSIPHIHDEIKNLSRSHQEVQKRLAAAEEDYNEKKALFPEVIRLDSEIKGQKEQFKKAEISFNEFQRESLRINQELNRNLQEIAQLEKGLSRIEKEQSELSPYTPLEKDFKDLQTRIITLREYEKELNQLTEEKKKKYSLKEIAEKKYSDILRERERLQKQLNSKTEEKTQLSEKINDILENETIDTWLERREEARNEAERLISLENTGREYREIRTLLKESESRTWDEEIKLLKKNKEKLENESLELKRDLQDLAEKKELENRIRSLSERRKELKEGEACPLCGATHHPFAQNTPPEISITESRIEEKKHLLDKSDTKIKELTGELAVLKEKKDNCQREMEKLSKRSEELIEVWKSLNNDLESYSLEISLREETESAHIKEKKALKALEESRPLIHQRDSLDSSLTELREKIASENLYLKEKQGEIQTLTEVLETLSKTEKKVLGDIQSLGDTLSEQLCKAGLSLPDSENTSDFLHRLERSVIRIRELRDEKTDFTFQKIQLSSAIENSREKGKDNQNKSARITEEINGLESQLSYLSEKRYSLLKDQSVEEVEERLKENFINFLESEKREKEALDLKEKEKEKEELTLLLKEKEMREHSVRFREHKESLIQKVRHLNIPDLNTLSEYYKNRNFFQETEKVFKDLDTQRTELSVKEKNLQNELLKEETEIQGGPLEEEVIQKIDELENRHHEITKNLTQRELQLEQQKKMEKEQIKRLEKLSKQKQESDLWDTMNTLIGSADGKKFRKFVQSLTLDTLIRLANIHLRTLSDRYLLTRGSDDLEIEIIDTYQADTVRPAKTLSGGEGFLISLALALGLSRLSSRKTPVESLFLDEGFGTLDSETLDTALSALHNLQAAGKSIGVISHIDALKERIPARIEIRKKRAGCSEILLSS